LVLVLEGLASRVSQSRVLRRHPDLVKFFARAKIGSIPMFLLTKFPIYNNNR